MPAPGLEAADIVETVSFQSRPSPMAASEKATEPTPGRLEIRSMSWVLKQLFREQKKKEAKPAKEKSY